MRSFRQHQIDELRAQFAGVGQEHVFAFWDQLDAIGQEALIRQARRIGPTLPLLLGQRETALAALEGSGPTDLAPCHAIALPEHGGDRTALARARGVGQELLQQGRVAVLVVAGGQGTRLGFDGPKGAFPIGPVSPRTLFGLQAQKLTALGRRSGQAIRWFVMTSPSTDAETRALFEREDHFGLDPEQIFIFSQGTVPAWTLDGKLILERPDCIFESPGGHGDTFLALAQSGALDQMEKHGIDRLFYYQVDNPLVQMADPVFLGFHESEGAAMSCKVIRKVDPMEKLGVMARSGDQPSLVDRKSTR
ncbi:MAG: UTP--glucose-1-phosphate uridylyltransferase, partial [Myxococcota bacterium]